MNGITMVLNISLLRQPNLDNSIANGLNNYFKATTQVEISHVILIQIKSIKFGLNIGLKMYNNTS